MTRGISPTGFIVLEAAEDFEQVLALQVGAGLPPGGILTWSTPKLPRVLFASRIAARQAIERTEHYRLAFGLTQLPERADCRIVPMSVVDTELLP